MNHMRKAVGTLAMGMAGLILMVPAAAAQDAAPAAPATASTADTKASSSTAPVSSQSFLRGGLGSFGLPDLFARHLIANFSVGYFRDNGILNGRFANSGMTSASYTDLSSGFAYDYRRARSDYTINYGANARHYSQFSQLDVVGQDLGVSQSWMISRRVNWKLDHRFSMTPDWAGSLMAETLASQLGFLNPLPTVEVFGAGPSESTAFLNPLPAGATIIPRTFQPATSATAGLLTLRSMRMTNLSNAALTFDASPLTQMSLNLGFSRLRYQDPNLFGSNNYTVSGGVSHLISPGTSVALRFTGTRFDMSSVFQKTTYGGIQVGFTHRLGRRSYISAEFGPGYLTVDAQQKIALPSLVANLLGRSSLVRDNTRQNIGWLGAAGYGTVIRNTGLHFDYSRIIGDSAGLGGATVTQTGSVSVSKTILRRNNISISMAYMRMQMLGLQLPLSLHQQALTASFNRQVSRNVDFTAIFNYAKFNRTRFNGPTLLDHNIVGVRLTYYFHRLSAADAGLSM